MKTVSLGIDLGTTNSVITYCFNNGAMEYNILKVPNSRNGILPSCVEYLSKDACVVGQTAYESRWKKSVSYSMKRHMVEGDNFKQKIIAEDGSEFEVSPIDVGAEVLKHMKNYAEQYLGIDGKEVTAKYTITVPAYFNEVARYNTIEAGVRAGIPRDDIVLINEPTAAALSYGSRGKKNRERVLVYDLDGGTFDVAILDIIKDSNGKPKFEVKNCAGDDNLGGDDLDCAIADLIIEKAVEKMNNSLEESGSNLKVNEEMFKRDVDYKKRVFNAETCKKELKSITVSIPLAEIALGDNLGLVADCLGDDYVIKINIVEKDIRRLSDKVLIGPTTKIIDKLLLESSSIKPNKMLLIGGSTKGEELVDSLEDYYPNLIISNTSDPDLSVSIGAAIYTEMCQQGEDNRLQDVIQLPIGVLNVDDNGREYVNKIIRQNSKIPVNSTQIYRTLSDDQEAISVKVYQGRSTNPDDNIYLGELVVDNLQKFRDEKIEKIKDDIANDRLSDGMKEKLQAIKAGKEENDLGILDIEITLSVNVSGVLKAAVGINGHIFVAKINRLAAGKEKKMTKEESIKNRQINNLKSLVPKSDLEQVLKDYELAFEKGIKEASAYVKKIKTKYDFENTEYF